MAAAPQEPGHRHAQGKHTHMLPRPPAMPRVGCSPRRPPMSPLSVRAARANWCSERQGALEGPQVAQAVILGILQEFWAC